MTTFNRKSVKKEMNAAQRMLESASFKKTLSRLKATIDEASWAGTYSLFVKVPTRARKLIMSILAANKFHSEIVVMTDSNLYITWIVGVPAENPVPELPTARSAAHNADWVRAATAEVILKELTDAQTAIGNVCWREAARSYVCSSWYVARAVAYHLRNADFTVVTSWDEEVEPLGKGDAPHSIVISWA